MVSVAQGTLRLFAFHAPDARIQDVLCQIEYTSTDFYRSAVRGMWSVSLVEEITSFVSQASSIPGRPDPRFRPVTKPVQVRNPRTEPFRLGSPIVRLKYGRPVYLEIVYSATDGPEALFWQGSVAVNCTAHLA